MDINEVLANLRAALERATRYQVDDTDHDSFCVVPNRTVTEIVKVFGALDDSLSSGGILPEEWARTGR